MRKRCARADASTDSPSLRLRSSPPRSSRFPGATHVEASGRIAPQRWARVHSEAPGVVREVTRTSGDAVEEGDVIAVLDSDEQRDALEAARLALARERQKLADLELRLRENAILREGADARRRIREGTGGRRGAHRWLPARGARSDRGRGARRRARFHNRSARRALDESQRACGSRVRGRGSVPESAGREWRAIPNAPPRSPTTSPRSPAPRPAGSSGPSSRTCASPTSLADHSMEEILDEARARDAGPPRVRGAPRADRSARARDHANSRMASARSREAPGPCWAPARSRASACAVPRRAGGSSQTSPSASRRSAPVSRARSPRPSSPFAPPSATRARRRSARPIRGTLAGEALARFDAVGANTSVGVVEDANRLVLKVRVDESRRAPDRGRSGGRCPRT